MQTICSVSKAFGPHGQKVCGRSLNCNGALKNHVNAVHLDKRNQACKVRGEKAKLNILSTAHLGLRH